MPGEELFRNADFSTDLANFVLVKRCQGLDNATGLDQRLNACDSVVVRLNEIRLSSAAGFDGVGINRPLTEDPLTIKKVLCRYYAFLHFYKLLSNYQTLLLGVVNSA